MNKEKAKNPHGFDADQNMISKMKYYHKETKQWYNGADGLANMLAMHRDGNKQWPDVEDLKVIRWSGTKWMVFDSSGGHTWFSEDEIKTELLTVV